VRAVLFDLDDTLLDYSGGVDGCWSAACAAVALPDGCAAEMLAAALAAERRRFWSDPVRHARERVDMLGAWRKIAAAALEAVGVPSAGLAAALAEDFAARRRAAMRLFPDALPCLDALRARGVRLALVTNGDAAMQRDKVARFDLARWFDAIVIEGELGCGKPDPAVYRHALRAIEAPERAAAMVGDHLDWDVRAPQALGLRGIWIDRAGGGLAPDGVVRPDAIIRSLAELGLP
jgi:putative hydrolase of the HAD superfamily